VLLTALISGCLLLCILPPCISRYLRDCH